MLLLQNLFKRIATFFNKKIIKSKHIASLIRVFIIICLLGILTLILLQKPPEQTSYTVIEPEVPVSSDFSLKVLGDTSVIGNTQITQSPTSGPSPITSIPYIETVRYSPDSLKTLILSWTADPSRLKSADPTIKDTNTPTLKLSLLTEGSTEIKNIISKDILNAEFSSNNQIYYQKMNDDYGLFVYNIKTGTNKKFISTTTLESFKSIAFIDDDTYYFIQPKTGKYGYGNISTDKTTILGQNADIQETYIDKNMAFYTDMYVSEDKSLIGVVDNKLAESQKKTLNLFAKSDRDLKNPLLKVEFESLLNDGNILQKTITTSNNGRFLTIGSDIVTIDLTTKKTLFKGESGRINTISFSPDGTKIITCVQGSNNGYCKMKAIESNSISEYADLPKDISQTQWINNEVVVFSVGRSLYDYKVSKKLLEKVVAEQDAFTILARNNLKNSILILQKDIPIEIEQIKKANE